MKQFFRVLFFAKTVLLTPIPADIDGRLELALKEPIEAITAGAGIEIDISSMIDPAGAGDMMEFETLILQHFPPGSIAATLSGDGTQGVALSYQGDFGVSDTEIVLLLNAGPDGVPTGVPYSKVIIESDVALQDVTVTWKNHRK